MDVNVRCCTSGHREVTALMLAASCGNESISTALLNRGADVNARNKEGWTALFHATNGNHANLGAVIGVGCIHVNTEPLDRKILSSSPTQGYNFEDSLNCIHDILRSKTAAAKRGESGLL